MLSGNNIILPSPVFSPEEITRFRNDTSGCKHVVHLNNAGAGLMPDVVTKAITDHITLESLTGGYEAAALRADAIQLLYTRTAQLLHCKPGNIAFTSSATDAYIRALSSIPFQQGDVILTTKDDYISNQLQFLSLQKRYGLRIERLQNAPEGGIDLQDLETKLHTLQPRLLAITHIPTNSGLVQPVHAIGEIYSRYEQQYGDKTWYLLDACQSAGQVKLDVEVLKCDFLSATGRKFLRGPRGTGLLYVSDKALRAGLEPLYIDMRGAEWITKDSYEPRKDAMRYEDWEFPYALVLGTSEAIDYCLHVGEDRIWQQVKQHAAFLREELAAKDRVRVLDRGREKGALVTFTVSGSSADYLKAALLKRTINVATSIRGFAVIDFDEKEVEWAIRVSPHYYNTPEELILFLDALDEIIRG